MFSNTQSNCVLQKGVIRYYFILNFVQESDQDFFHSEFTCLPPSPWSGITRDSLPVLFQGISPFLSLAGMSQENASLVCEFGEGID